MLNIFLHLFVLKLLYGQNKFPQNLRFSYKSEIIVVALEKKFWTKTLQVPNEFLRAIFWGNNLTIQKSSALSSFFSSSYRAAHINYGMGDISPP